MKNLTKIIQKPIGQVLLATLLFCFIFVALFAGLYKAGISYITKERSRRAVNLTALSGGAVYAYGLQLVRDSNSVLLGFATADMITYASRILEAAATPPPADVAAVVLAIKTGDPDKRKSVRDIQKQLFGIDLPQPQPGALPALIEAQAMATAGENQLSSFPPLYAYNYETAKGTEMMVPNMGLTFRTLADLFPDASEKPYSLLHKGERHYFSSDEVESARNPRFPHQMRVKKHGGSEYAGWWVRKEKNGSDSGASQFMGGVASNGVFKEVIKKFKGLFDHVVLDVVDIDDPPCHTFTMLGTMKSNNGNESKDFYQAGECRVDEDGLAAWDLLSDHPIKTYLTGVDLEAFPVLKDLFNKLQNIPMIDKIQQGSDLLGGL